MVSVPPTYRRYAVVALALLLVFNPLYLDSLLHLDDPNRYEYHAERVSFAPNGDPEKLPSDLYERSLDDNVACFLARDRTCALEQHILDHSGPVPVDEFRPYAAYDYAYIDGQFYEVTYTRNDSETLLRLNETTHQTALGSAATPLSFASAGAREVVEDGPVTRRTQIPDEHQLLVDDGDYYVVYPKYGRSYGERVFEERRRQGTILEGALSALGVAVGLGLWTLLVRRR